jgi:hypothetical protein
LCASRRCPRHARALPSALTLGESDRSLSLSGFPRPHATHSDARMRTRTRCLCSSPGQLAANVSYPIGYSGGCSRNFAAESAATSPVLGCLCRSLAVAVSPSQSQRSSLHHTTTLTPTSPHYGTSLAPQSAADTSSSSPTHDTSLPPIPVARDPLSHSQESQQP